MEESMVREFSIKLVDRFLKVIILCTVMHCLACNITKSVVLFHGCFSRFLNFTNGTKSRNASQLLLTYFLPLFPFIQKQPPEVLCKKAVLKNFTKFTGKFMFWSLFFNKVTSLIGLQLY